MVWVYVVSFSQFFFVFCLWFSEVMKVLKAKKNAKTKKTEVEKLQSKTVKPEEKDSSCERKKEGDSNQGKTYQVYIIF